ncbi:DUF5938 domain-containing protein [Rhizobium sp. FKY42]|uniref:saccharopine dehydrogenase family protein n=1 Tax=Rhizobium sp. FKY42 TaxID=2562310 RepID=UPI0010C09FE8|nr:DUF5938 domain-containing protein [Rhizobium sp. FKY42]
MSIDYPVVVYGANGYTGRLVCEHLGELGIPFIAAGRSKKKLEEMMQIVPGIERSKHMIVEVENTVEALSELVRGRKVVCNTVGPMNRFARELLQACYNERVSYLDTTGEQHWIRELMDHWHEKFRSIERLVIPSCSYMYGVCELGARVCLETPGIDSIDATSIADGVPTVASARTILDAIRHPSVYLKNNELVPYKGIENSRITSPEGTVLTASTWGGTALPIWFSRDGRIRNAKMMCAMWNQELYKKELELERLNKTTFQWIPDEILYPMMDKMAEGITAGTPPRESRYVHRAIDVCVGRGPVGMVKTTMVSNGGYYTTGLIQAYVASRLVYETPPKVVGFASPSEAFGHRNILGVMESYGYAKLGVQKIIGNHVEGAAA